jgi:hypothetical protein
VYDRREELAEKAAAELAALQILEQQQAQSAGQTAKGKRKARAQATRNSRAKRANAEAAAAAQTASASEQGLGGLANVDVDEGLCQADDWRSKSEGARWGSLADYAKYQRVLASVGALTNLSFDDLSIVKVDKSIKAGCLDIEADDDVDGTLEINVNGLDGGLSSEECLQALQHIFEVLGGVDSVAEADAFHLPSPRLLKDVQPLELSELGFRKTLLPTQEQPEGAPIILSPTQLQSGVWFARRSIFDVQVRFSEAEDNREASSEAIEQDRDWSTGGCKYDPNPLLLSRQDQPLAKPFWLVHCLAGLASRKLDLRATIGLCEATTQNRFVAGRRSTWGGRLPKSFCWRARSLAEPVHKIVLREGMLCIGVPWEESG